MIINEINKMNEKKLFDKLTEHNISITFFWNFNGEIKDIKLDTAEHDARVRADAIDEVLEKCTKEYQLISQDTVCKIWLSTLEQLKERK